MRPCCGTSGLVLGNRRKAVFAFKGLFSKGVFVAFSLWAVVFYRRFPEVRGKIENCRAQSDLHQQSRRSRRPRIGDWSVDFGFSPHFRIGRSFSTLDVPTFPKKVLKTALKAPQLALTA